MEVCRNFKYISTEAFQKFLSRVSAIIKWTDRGNTEYLEKIVLRCYTTGFMHFCFQVKNVSTINGCVRLSTVSTVFTCIFKHYCLLMQRQITGTFTLFQTLFLLLFWISFFLLTQVFVLWWLSFNWEILITLLSQFPLTFHHIQNRMPCFIALCMAILMLIETSLWSFERCSMGGYL